MNNLTNKLAAYISDPKDPRYNFFLGKAYEDLNHTAAAVGFYLRAAECDEDDLLTYEALLRMALCLSKQGSRVFTVKGVLLRAVSLLPERPEAYFLLSRTYEINRDWQESYTWACLGEEKFGTQFRCDGFLGEYNSACGPRGTLGTAGPSGFAGLGKGCHTNIETDVEYPGAYGFVFEKAVSGWWIGLYDESLYLFRLLSKRTDLTSEHRNAVNNNLITLKDNWKEPLAYTDALYEKACFKFEGLKKVKQNYSQCYQDLFVLTMLNGKHNGSYVEIGCGDPFYGSNTALLEKDFGWAGLSIDIDQDAVNKFAEERKNKVYRFDAAKAHYDSLISDLSYDYLQIDCDPALTSLEVLLRIPFERTKFAVITFEHDFYADELSGVKERSRAYLTSLGYKLVVGDIAPDKFNSFEDWWVHPQLVEKDIIARMEVVNGRPKRADDYMFGRL